jgi:hypothetical protein
MDYETFQNFMNSQESVYVAVTLGGAVVGATISYLANRLSSSKSLKSAELERDKVISIEETKREQIGLEQLQAQNTIELKKLEYEHAQGEHERKLELMAKDREYKLEDKERTRKIILENEELDRKRLFELRIQERAHEVEMAEKLSTLKPLLIDYLCNLDQSNSEDKYLEERNKFRKELIEDVLEDYEKNEDGLMYQIITAERDAIGDDLLERINNIVDAKYPLNNNQPKMPPELKKLVDLVTQNS